MRKCLLLLLLLLSTARSLAACGRLGTGILQYSRDDLLLLRNMDYPAPNLENWGELRRSSPNHDRRRDTSRRKRGGLICMTTRTVRNNLVYKASLEQELKQMEEERLWTCVNVTEVEKFQLAVAEHEENEFIGGCVYLYRVSPL